MKKSEYRFLASMLSLAAVMPLCAQELHERLEVEGQYEYDKLPAHRLDRLPQFERFQAADSKLEYSTNGVPADFSPSAPDALATVWGAERKGFIPRGYINLTLGSWLDSDLSAGYSILRSKEQHLGVRLQHNSTSLWRPFGAESPTRFSYQEEIGVDYSKIFAGKGILSVSGQYHLGYFNYYGGDPIMYAPDASRPPQTSAGVKYEAPTQTLNDVAARIGWRSASADRRLAWNAAAGVRYFGYRTATRELDIMFDGGISHSWSAASSLGLNVDADVLTYKSSAHDMPRPDTYGSVCLNPYYRLTRNSMTLRVGADLDLTFNADGAKAGEHYGFFHAAPDVRFDVTGKNVGFYIHLLGGTELHTLAGTSQLDPYRNPQLLSTRPVYTPLDANIGMELTPFAGFRARLNLQYKVTRNVWAGGWYSAILDYGHVSSIPGLQLPAGAIAEYGDGLQRYNISGFGVGVDLGYKLSRYLTLGVDGTYTPQHDATGIFNGLDRPRWTLNAVATVNPLDKLSLTLGYQYRGVRRIFTTYYPDPSLKGLYVGGSDEYLSEKPELASMRLRDITRLNFRASWSFTDRFSIHFQADNLLNQKAEILPCLPTEGIVIAGGLQWLF